MIRTICFTGLLVAGLALPVMGAGRPGGGETYSGSSRSDDSAFDDVDDSDGGEAAALLLLIELCIRYPKLGVAVIFAVVGFVGFHALMAGTTRDWDSASTSAVTAAASSGSTLEDIKRVDPNFSSVLFEDFLFRLYATGQLCRNTPRKLDELAPYLSVAARRALSERPPAGEPVTGVVVGAMRVYRVNVPTRITEEYGPQVVKVGVEFEANYSVGPAPGRRHFVVETWALQRRLTAITRPKGSERFPCPNCGAPWQTIDAARTQKCASCGEIVDNGRFDWQVIDIKLRHERDTLPGLHEEVPEQGTSSATKRDVSIDDDWRTFTELDKTVTETSIDEKLRYIYQVVNDAWVQGDLGPARRALSDGLADYLQYWLDAYEQQGLRNVLKEMRITRHERVKLRRDRYYDALTIRIWATGKDYVVRTADGNHVRGNPTQDREYSEYWTLIRATGIDDLTALKCPACGASLTVAMGGACEHCGAHVRTARFDWVLSKIEQDDAYRT